MSLMSYELDELGLPKLGRQSLAGVDSEAGHNQAIYLELKLRPAGRRAPEPLSVEHRSLVA